MAPMLKELGIDTVYLSPITKPVDPSSSHGYNVGDYNQVNPEIGGEQGFAELTDQLSALGMGALIDFVPNHMGVGTNNAWWRDGLQFGDDARSGDYFDIDETVSAPTSTARCSCRPWASRSTTSCARVNPGRTTACGWSTATTASSSPTGTPCWSTAPSTVSSAPPPSASTWRWPRPASPGDRPPGCAGTGPGRGRGRPPPGRGGQGGARRRPRRSPGAAGDGGRRPRPAARGSQAVEQQLGRLLADDPRVAQAFKQELDAVNEAGNPGPPAADPRPAVVPARRLAQGDQRDQLRPLLHDQRADPDAAGPSGGLRRQPRGRHAVAQPARGQERPGRSAHRSPDGLRDPAGYPRPPPAALHAAAGTQGGGLDPDKPCRPSTARSSTSGGSCASSGPTPRSPSRCMWWSRDRRQGREAARRLAGVWRTARSATRRSTPSPTARSRPTTSCGRGRSTSASPRTPGRRTTSSGRQARHDGGQDPAHRRGHPR